MARTLQAFCEATNISTYNFANVSDLPCFAHRCVVSRGINKAALIKELLSFASAATRNDVLVFSVTEQDGQAWQAWKDYAKAHPKTFKVVEGGSIHGRYMCRMYIYSKPAAKRKFGNFKGK
jgi:hypothetical protein